jgi:hypothetical protein
MKRGILHYFLAVWFSFLLLLGNTPMEFVHSFAGHKDTVHHEHKGLSFENKHHHCAFLSLTLTCFINDFSVPYVTLRLPVMAGQHTSFGPRFVQRAIIAASLRGPPAA